MGTIGPSSPRDRCRCRPGVQFEIVEALASRRYARGHEALRAAGGDHSPDIPRMAMCCLKPLDTPEFQASWDRWYPTATSQAWRRTNQVQALGHPPIGIVRPRKLSQKKLGQVLHDDISASSRTVKPSDGHKCRNARPDPLAATPPPAGRDAVTVLNRK